MKNVLIGTTMIAGLIVAGAAQAADMPLKAQMAPAYFSWTGFYVGGNFGGGWSDASFSITPTGSWLGFPASIPNLIATDKTLHPTSFMGGGQVGYNYQINNFVWGIEADIDSYQAKTTFIGGAIPTTSITAISQGSQQHWLATVRGRLGIAWDRVLIYGTAGLAASDWDVNMHMTSGGADAVFLSDKTRTGWTAGGGFEVAAFGNWSIKGEYLYADLGHATGSSVFPSPPNGAGFTHDHSVHLITQMVRFGINYHFW